MPTVKIPAPKVDSGKQFELISVHWFTTYPKMNPFIGSPRCKCGYPALFYRHIGDLHGGAVTINEFACPVGHVWENRETND